MIIEQIINQTEHLEKRKINVPNIVPKAINDVKDRWFLMKGDIVNIHFKTDTCIVFSSHYCSLDSDSLVLFKMNAVEFEQCCIKE